VRLTVLGAGDAFGTGGRLQACFLLETTAARVLVDCGATSLSALKGREIDPNAIDAILISHLHGDHFGGLPFFLLDAQFQSRRQAPLAILGPPGLETRLEAAMECFFPGSTRNRWRFDWSVRELPEGPNDLGWATVTAAEGRHPCGAPPYAYRIEAEGRVFAYTGDTEWVDGLGPILTQADLALAECYFPEPKAPFHLDLATLAVHARSLGLARVLATHMGPDMLAAAKTAPPPFIPAAEGMTLDV